MRWSGVGIAAARSAAGGAGRARPHPFCGAQADGEPPVSNTAVNAFLLICAGLFPIVNPVGGAPIFLALTRHSTDREREAIARRVAVNSLVLLLGSLFVGSYVLE